MIRLEKLLQIKRDLRNANHHLRDFISTHPFYRDLFLLDGVIDSYERLERELSDVILEFYSTKRQKAK